MTAARHVWPAGQRDLHDDDDCPCEPDIEIRTRADGTDGVVVVHRRIEEEGGEVL